MTPFKDRGATIVYVGLSLGLIDDYGVYRNILV